AAPQNVTVLLPWGGKFTSVDKLREALSLVPSKARKSTGAPSTPGRNIYNFQEAKDLFAWGREYSDAHKDDSGSLDRYATWLMFMMAAAYEFGDAGRELARIASYDPEEISDRKWASFFEPCDNPITILSVTAWAKERGWTGSVNKTAQGMF